MQLQGLLQRAPRGWILPALALWAILNLVDRSQDLESQRSPAGRPGAHKAHGANPVEQPPDAFPNALRVPFVVEDGDSYCNLGINNLSNSPGTVKISLLSREGSSLGSRSVRVLPHGMVQVNHVVSYLQDFPTENSEGHLIIESDQDTRAWVSLIDRQSLDSNVMLASDETANRVLIPSSVTSDHYSSGLVVVNTSAATGSLKITIRNAGGSTLGTRSEVPVAPQGSIYFKDIFQTAGIAPGSK